MSEIEVSRATPFRTNLVAEIPSITLPEAAPTTTKYAARIRDFGKEAFANLFAAFPVLVLRTDDELERAKEFAERLRSTTRLVNGELEYLDLLDLVIANYPSTKRDAGEVDGRVQLGLSESVDSLSTVTVVPVPQRATEVSEPFHAPTVDEMVAAVITEEPAEVEIEEHSESALADLASVKVVAGVPVHPVSKSKKAKR